MSASAPDALDWKIIALLQVDGRTSNREIARKLEVSETAVRSRIKRLENDNVIAIRAVGDVARADQVTGAATIAVRIHAGRIEDVARRLLALEPVVMAFSTIGRYDLIVAVLLPDPMALADFVLNELDRTDGIESTLTFHTTIVVKHDFNWVRLPG